MLNQLINKLLFIGSASKDELNVPLLKSETKEKIENLELLLSLDEILIFDEEGSELSKATSLSSLDTYVSEKDWLETLKSFGPKFKHLADLTSGAIDFDENSVKSYKENVDGSEV